ncbi:Arc family DNA-binding protein [Smaragdicoccus niigatensis]|uniref:Arc family DNA-binding protein n=1 Tax=Smaragdicoccus niigatensis TaxID=359359 RepID=UPI00035D8855|nr:Arc family DNA-binding protein [Smaragdicoccus niigatensis]
MAMTLRIPDELNEQLRESAKAQGISMQSAVILAIAEYVERREVSMAAHLAQEFVKQNRELIDRLAQ